MTDNSKASNTSKLPKRNLDTVLPGGVVAPSEKGKGKDETTRQLA